MAMSLLADPENPPPAAPCPPPCSCPPPSRAGGRGRCFLFLFLFLLPLVAALGAAGAAVSLGMLRGDPPLQAATAAHMLLSGGFLRVPSRPSWRYEEGITGVFLSHDLEVTGGQLRVTSGGLYLFYAQFTLTCTSPTCPTGTVTLQLHRHGSQHPLLAASLVLLGGPGCPPARSGLAQAVGQLQPGDILSLSLLGDIKGDGWQLAQEEREGNFVGLLRIAGG